MISRRKFVANLLSASILFVSTIGIIHPVSASSDIPTQKLDLERIKVQDQELALSTIQDHQSLLSAWHTGNDECSVYKADESTLVAVTNGKVDVIRFFGDSTFSINGVKGYYETEVVQKPEPPVLLRTGYFEGGSENVVPGWTFSQLKTSRWRNLYFEQQLAAISMGALVALAAYAFGVNIGPWMQTIAALIKATYPPSSTAAKAYESVYGCDQTWICEKRIAKLYGIVDRNDAYMGTKIAYFWWQ